MTDKASGLATAIEIAMGRRDGDVDEAGQPEQLHLLPEDRRPGLQVVPGGRDGPGRPAGSRNKRTEAWTDYLLSRYTSPVESLLRIGQEIWGVLATRTNAEIERDFGCNRFQLMQLLRDVSTGAAPFVHQRQPIAVDVGDAGLVPLVIGLFAGQTPQGGGEIVLDAEILADQSLSDGSDRESDDSESDGR